MTLPRTPGDAATAATQPTSPDEVFLDTREGNEEEESGEQQKDGTNRWKSDRKRPSVDYTNRGRGAKKQKDSQGTARNLSNLEDDQEQGEEDSWTKLVNMIAALDVSINKKIRNLTSKGRIFPASYRRLPLVLKTRSLLWTLRFTE